MAVRSVSNFSTPPLEYGKNLAKPNLMDWGMIMLRLQGDPGVRNLMLNIEDKDRLSHPYMGTLVEEKVAQLFTALREPLATEFKKWDIRLYNWKTFDEACMELQAARNAAVDKDLNSIWRNDLQEQVKNMGAFSENTYPIGVPAIRSWMSRDASQRYLRHITTLDLSGLFLSVFPREISLCRNLRNLQLHTNNFSSFPYDLNEWFYLEICNLSMNRLDYFLESIQPHPSLKILDLSANCLQTFSYGFNGYPKLEGLYLHDNPFESLSCSLTTCVDLKELSLTTSLIRDFHFQLPPAINLYGSLIVGMSIQDCVFSYPALRAEVNVNAPLGWRLSVLIDDPSYRYISLGESYSFFYCFFWMSESWKGMIPLNKNFKFALIDLKEELILEEKQEWRKVSIAKWGQKSVYATFADVSFAPLR